MGSFIKLGEVLRLVISPRSSTVIVKKNVSILSVRLSLFRYIMTSEFTLAPTEKFFKENNFFGLEPSNVIMFEQRMIPAVSFDGKVVLQGKGKIAMAPGWCPAGVCVRYL